MSTGALFGVVALAVLLAWLGSVGWICWTHRGQGNDS